MLSVSWPAVGCSAAWTALPWLASRLFGLRHFGANFGAILTLSGPVVLALTFGVAPAFYGAHAGERAAPDCDGGGDDDGGSADACFGDACYGGYFVAVIACAALGVLTSLELLRRRLIAIRT